MEQDNNLLKLQALFADETADYKTPYEPNKDDIVTLKFRTLKNNAASVLAVIRGVARNMKKCKNNNDPLFDFYEISFKCPDKEVYYYFHVKGEVGEVYYNRIGATFENKKEHYFRFTPGFHVPDWAKGRIFYQIYTDRFCNGDESNDVVDNEYYYTGGHSHHVTDWNKGPATLDVNNFYGGDLQGVESKIDYLTDLGIEGVYFNPLFVSPSNHKYDTQDYDNIDPHFAIIEEDAPKIMGDWEKHNGYAEKYIRRVTSKVNLEKSNAYFASLVQKLHDRDIRVVIDGVFNHCGSFNKWMDREGIYLYKDGYELGAFQSTDSPYRNYFHFDKNEDYSSYEGWWDVPTLPKLNYEKSEELTEYILNTGAKWVSAPYNVDGWRLDVGADLGHSPATNHKFWQKFRTRVKGANPEAFIFAEHYGSAEKWFNGKEWDSVMNYDAFMEPVTFFLTGMEKHSNYYDGYRYNNGNLFFDCMKQNMAIFPRPSLDSAINQLSNHDHSRFLTRTNRTPGTLATKGGEAAMDNISLRVMELAVLMQMTWVGCPTLYYADEAGQVGWTDPDCRRTYPWGRENKGLVKYHKEVIAARKKIDCLKMGSIKPISSGEGYIAYARFNKNDCAVVVINNSDCEMGIKLHVWEIGVGMEDEMEKVFTVGYKLTEEDRVHKVKDGKIIAKMPAKSGCIYYKKF